MADFFTGDASKDGVDLLNITKELGHSPTFWGRVVTSILSHQASTPRIP
jgi:hypothetical protein